LIPAVIVLTTLLLAIVSWDDVLGSEPLADPLGYENANAALILQATVGSLMLFKMGRRSALRAVGVTAAVGLGGLTLLVGSVAGDVLLALAAATVFPRRPQAARGTVWACAALLLFALMVTVGLGATFDNGARSGSIDRVADAAFSERRVALWHDALVIIGQRPGIGVGAGQFWLHSPVGRSDRDARWAHQEFLQHGAEAGVVGFLLLVCMFGWALGRLLVVPSPNTLVALGAGSVAILGIHACIDYVLHFVVLPISAAALVGTAVGNGSIEARR
jgi:O-antigen ligase